MAVTRIVLTTVCELQQMKFRVAVELICLLARFHDEVFKRGSV